MAQEDTPSVLKHYVTMCNLPTLRMDIQTLFLLFLGSLERSYMAYAAPAKQPPAPTNLHDVQSGTRTSVVLPICY